jgi:phosphohistidine swiveling domain-containing protein
VLCVWLHDLARADERCGGKAVGLSRLIAAGLPVPAGFAIDGAAFEHVAQLTMGSLDDAGHALAEAAARIERAELPDFERELRARAALLGPHVIVRSSASFEDGATGAAAGVLESIRDPDDVWAAVRAVWTSALAPIAVAYARERAAALRVGVIVQALAPGELVTIYTRPPGRPDADELLVQRGDTLVREPRSAPGALGSLALAAEAAIGATAGADVELAGDRVVQARPIVHPVTRARQAPPAIVLAPLHDGRTWTWDVAHNPDPLSPAQAGLVELVAGLGAYELRVCGGYLYTMPRPDFAFDDASADAVLARLDAELAAATGTLDDALDRYVRCYAIWANELSPLVARTRGKSPAHRPSSVEATLARAARGELDLAGVLDRIGDLAPAWDVAVPSFRELPGTVEQAIERAVPIETQTVGSLADLAERDDLYFARMQHLMRRALLARSIELDLDGDDIFWLSLDDARGTLDRDVAHRRASAARAASARAAAWDMPFVVGGEPRSPSVALRGVGSGPRVIGRAVRFATLAGARFVGAGDVVVVRAVTPALAMFVGRCAAIVSETGGLLDHGAALAHELGITCVVGCHDAWHQLADGTIVTVDGDAGIVYSSSSS